MSETVDTTTEETEGMAAGEAFLLGFAGATAEMALSGVEVARQVNLAGDIEWGLREKVRAIQGHFDKIDDLCFEILSSMGTTESAYLVNQIWDLEPEG